MTAKNLPEISTGTSSPSVLGGSEAGAAGGSSQGFDWTDPIFIGPTPEEIQRKKQAEAMKKLKRDAAAKMAERKAAQLPDDSAEHDERALLGMLPVDDRGRAFDAIHAAGLKPEHFTTPEGAVLAEIIGLHRAGIPIDLVTIAGHLTNGVLEAIGGRIGLHRIVDDAPPIQYAAYHAGRIAEATLKRTLAAEAEEWLTLAQNGTNSAELIPKIRAALDRAEASKPAGKPDVFSLVQLAESEIDAASILLGSDGIRYLCSGGTMLFVGPSGVGKSTASAQQDILWALGRPAFGITPARPLRILTIQAENDKGDLTHMARGIMAALCLTSEERNIVDAGTLYLSHNATSGAEFIQFVDRELSRYRPHLLRIDCLSAYAGGDLTKPDVIAQFCRCGLNRLATRHGCGIVVCHHTPKMTGNTANVQARKQWGAFDWQYAAAGGADLANWARAVLVIESLSRDVFAFRAAKRWPGWKDHAGNPEHVRFFQREREPGKVFWHDATASDVATSSASGSGPDLEALEGPAVDLVTEPLPPAVLKDRFRSKLFLSKNHSETLLSMLTMEGGRLVRWGIGGFPQRWLIGTPKQYAAWKSPSLSSLSSLSSCEALQETCPPACLPAPLYEQVGRQAGVSGRQDNQRAGRQQHSKKGSPQ
jgi:hypothetical protein